MTPSAFPLVATVAAVLIFVLPKENSLVGTYGTSEHSSISRGEKA